MEVLDQIPEFPNDYTVKDVLNTGFERLLSIQDQMKELEAKESAPGPCNPETIR